MAHMFIDREKAARLERIEINIAKLQTKLLEIKQTINDYISYCYINHHQLLSCIASQDTKSDVTHNIKIPGILILYMVIYTMI